METMLLTKKGVELLAFAPHHNDRYWVGDTKISFLRVLVSTRSRTYYFHGWCPVQRKKLRVKIGDHPHMHVDEAREIARQLYLKHMTPYEGKPTQEFARGKTVRDLVEFYFEHRPVDSDIKQVTMDGYRILADTWLLPVLGDVRVNFVSKDLIEDLRDRVKRADHPEGKKLKPSTTMANKVVSFTFRMFKFCIERKQCALNPAEGVKLDKTDPKQDFYEPGEVQALVRQCVRWWQLWQNGQALAILLGATTGMRRRTVLEAKWEHFHLDFGYWQIPGEYMKQGKAHRVYLGPELITIFSEWKQYQKENPDKFKTYALEGGWVFPGPGKAGHFGDPRNIMRRLTKAAGIKCIKFHGLRHTFISLAHALDHSDHICAAIAAHKIGGVHQRYVHALSDKMKEANLEIQAKLFSTEDLLNDDEFNLAQGRTPVAIPESSVLHSRYRFQ